MITYYLSDWSTFDGWCATQGCDPQQLSSRRMINLMIFFIEKDLEEKARLEFRYSLENLPQRIQTKKQPNQEPKKEQGTTIKYNSKNKWRAPEGWTPPGWSEERSYAAAKQFMGFQQSIKK